MEHERITIDPKVCGGKPVVKGTRTPVTIVLGHLAGGSSFDWIRQNFDLTDDDIRTAIGFANDELLRMPFIAAAGAV